MRLLTKRITVACVIWAVVASGAGASLATADPVPLPAPSVPAPSPFSAQRLAGALGEKVSSLAHMRMESAFACVQVRLFDSKSGEMKSRRRALVRFLITRRARLDDSRRLVARATTDITKGLKARHRRLALPRTRIHVVNPRYSDRTQQRIVKRLLKGARHWIGVPGVATIPGISWGDPTGSENFLPHCPPVKIVLLPNHTADQLDWARTKRHKYGSDRISIEIQRPSTGPPPVA